MYRILIVILFGWLPVSVSANYADAVPLNDYLEELERTLEYSLRQNSDDLRRILPMIGHIRSYYGASRPERSVTTADGVIVDCFRVERQPALLRRDGSYRALQSPPMRGAVAAGSDDSSSDCGPCRSGEVGIPRLSLEVMRRFRNLDEFLLKTPVPNSNLTASLVGGVNHYYATAIQAGEKLRITGARSHMNVWMPTVTSNNMSLSQLWLSSGTGSSTQTVESGWQVYPNKYSSERPAVFIFYTPDNYASGCYNLDCKAFVVVSSEVPIGQALPSSMISQTDGAQREILQEWTLNPETGSWWLWYEGGGVEAWAGYYPKSVFNDGAITRSADELLFGGEDTGQPKALQMGSGQFADQGYQQAAYQRDLRYRAEGSSSFTQATLSNHVVTEPCYTLDLFNSSIQDWYSYIYFGGPLCPVI